MAPRAVRKLDMQSKYGFNAFALQMQCTKEEAENFINDCINEFDLFASDDASFWSPSLLKRMKMRDERSEQAKAAARARWEKSSESDADAYADGMRTHSGRNALKERKVKEIKKENIKKKFAEFVMMTEDEHQKLVDKHGERKVARMIEVLDNYKGANGKKYKSDYRAILNWVVKRVEEEGQRQPPPKELDVIDLKRIEEEKELVRRARESQIKRNQSKRRNIQHYSH